MLDKIQDLSLECILNRLEETFRKLLHMKLFVWTERTRNTLRYGIWKEVYPLLANYLEFITVSLSSISGILGSMLFPWDGGPLIHCVLYFVLSSLKKICFIKKHYYYFLFIFKFLIFSHSWNLFNHHLTHFKKLEIIHLHYHLQERIKLLCEGIVHSSHWGKS